VVSAYRSSLISGRDEPVVYRANPRTAPIRRAIDLAVAAIALVLASPVLLLASLAIKLEDGGPVLFRQRRVGRFERLFTMYKLRTMRAELCEDALTPSSSRDPRITFVGSFLRKSSIDELPQLLNVVRGEMTLVGPRPEMPFLVRKYEPWQHLRHLATPGVTGLWQTRARSTIPLHLPEATRIDLEYITSASPRTDGLILIATVRRILSAHGAC
jgi:lipopolysaccharide/colanic/teichoic acid biosynthesis glycosyltransferase